MNDPLCAALDSLPHGPEFRFLDRLVALEPGVSAVAQYIVRGDEPFLRGHFPGDPIFPGVLLVEGGAQLAGILAQSGRRRQRARLHLTGLRGVKILGSARPGDRIDYQARLIGRLGDLIQAQVSASVDGRTVLQAEVTLCQAPACEKHHPPKNITP